MLSFLLSPLGAAGTGRPQPEGAAARTRWRHPDHEIRAAHVSAPAPGRKAAGPTGPAAAWGNIRASGAASADWPLAGGLVEIVQQRRDAAAVALLHDHHGTPAGGVHVDGEDAAFDPRDGLAGHRQLAHA